MNYTHKSEYNIIYKYSTYPNLPVSSTKTAEALLEKKLGQAPGHRPEGQALIDGPILVNVGAVAMGQVVPSKMSFSWKPWHHDGSNFRQIEEIRGMGSWYP